MKKKTLRIVSTAAGLMVFVLFLALGFPMQAQAEAETSARVLTFKQLKTAMEDPNITHVYIGDAENPTSNTSLLYAEEDGEPGLRVRGEKTLIIEKGSHEYSFHERSSEDNIKGFSCLFYVPRGSTLHITGGGILSYNPSKRQNIADYSLIRIAAGGKVDVMDTFEGELICTSNGKKHITACSLFRLDNKHDDDVAELIVRSENAYFATSPYPYNIDPNAALIYDQSIGSAKIVLLGGHYMPAGQFMINNTYTGWINRSIFFKDVEIDEQTHIGDVLKIFKTPGAAPAYAAYRKVQYSKKSTVTTMPFDNRSSEPNSQFLSPGEEKDMVVNINYPSEYISRIRAFIKDYGDDRYPLIPCAEAGNPKAGIAFKVRGTDSASKRILKLVFEYEYSGASWSMEREIYVITSAPGTEQEPVVVQYWHDLKKCLENPVIRYIKTDQFGSSYLELGDYDEYEYAAERYRITGDIWELDHTVSDMGFLWTDDPDVTGWLGYSLSNYAVSPKGEKHLELSEDLSITAGYIGSLASTQQKRGILYAIDLYNCDLTITGAGKLAFSGNSDSRFATSGAIHVGYNSSLTLEGKGIEASRNLQPANANQNGYSCAVYVSGTGSQLTVKDGTYSGGVYGIGEETAEYPFSTEGAAILAGKGASVEIQGGIFTDSYLGEELENGAYPGTEYARGSAALGLLYDKDEFDDPSTKQWESVSIKAGTFLTGIERCVWNSGNTSFKFKPFTNAYAENTFLDSLKSTLSTYQKTRSYVKVIGDPASFPCVTFTAPEVISKIELTNTGYNAPSENGTPFFQSLTRTGWSINENTDVCWIERETPDGDPTATITKGAENKFRANYYYTLSMTVHTTGSHVFSTDEAGRTLVKASLDGKPMTVLEPEGIGHDPSIELTLVFNYGKCNPTTITNVGVTLLIEPVHGMNPYDIPMLTSGTGYSLSDISWYEKNGDEWESLPDYTPQQFKYGKQYKATFTFEADRWGNPSYQFMATYDNETQLWNSDLTFSFNGAAPVPYTGERHDFNIQFNFMDFDSPILNVNQKSVDNILLNGLETPRPGKSPDFTVSSSEPVYYDVKSVSWKDSHDDPLTEESIFKAGETYTATLTVAPEKNEFSENVSIFANGTKCYVDKKAVAAENATVTGNSAVITLTYECPGRTGTPIKEAVATVKEPAAEMKFSECTYSFTTEHYMLGYGDSFAWYGTIKGKEKYLESDDKFERGQTYLLEIKLAPDSGYYFYEDEYGQLNITATINGQPAQITGDADEITISRTMTVPKEQIAVPTITAKWNKEANGHDITLSCAKKDAVIRYTIDGSDPGAKSTVYEGPFTLTRKDAPASSVTLRCYAAPKAGEESAYTDSIIAEKLLDFQTEFTVSFDANGGSGYMEPLHTTDGGIFTLPANTFDPPDGKVFDQWEVGELNNGIHNDPGAMMQIEKDFTAHALWKDKPDGPETYTIYYISGEGSGIMPAGHVEKGKELTFPENEFYAPEGKEFDKWSIDKTDITKKPGEKYTPFTDILVIALWKEPEGGPIYTVSFDSNGGSGEMPPLTTENGGSYTLPECTFAAPKDKQFDKWEIGAPGSGVFGKAGDSHTTDANITVYAVWKDVQQSDNPDDPTKTDPRKTPVHPDPIIKETTINGVPVQIRADITYPEAVTWTGDKITKEQLAALSEDGVTIAKVDITGLFEAIPTLKKNVIVSKLVTVKYQVTGKQITDGTTKAFFKVIVKLNKKAVKKAKIKGDNKKALQALVKELNDQLSKETYYFEIVPIELSDASVTSVTIKAKMKSKHVQLDENGMLKGIKTVTIKVKVPAGKNGKTKTKTYKYKASKVKKMFVITVTDATKKNKAIADIAASDTNTTFNGTKTGVTVKK